LTHCELTVLDEMPLGADGEIDRQALASGGVERATAARVAPRNEVERRVAEVWQEVLGVSEIGVHDNIFELGGNSLLLVQLHSKLESAFGPQLSVVDMFKYPTVDALARLLSGEDESAGPPVPVASGRERAAVRRRTESTSPSSGIAVIGLACRFPGANTPDQFWQNLRDGVESITFFSEDEAIAAGMDPDLVRDPNYVKAAPLLDHVEEFDAEMFGYTRREAEILDPQQRLMLECAWEALEDAGYDPRHCPGSVGVYAGAVLNTYLLNYVYGSRAHLDGDASEVLTLNSLGGFQVMVANDKDYLPTRISYSHVVRTRSHS
jgi:acyl carrier protein